MPHMMSTADTARAGGKLRGASPAGRRPPDCDRAGARTDAALVPVPRRLPDQLDRTGDRRSRRARARSSRARGVGNAGPGRGPGPPRPVLPPRFIDVAPTGRARRRRPVALSFDDRGQGRRGRSLLRPPGRPRQSRWTGARSATFAPATSSERSRSSTTSHGQPPSPPRAQRRRCRWIAPTSQPRCGTGWCWGEGSLGRCRRDDANTGPIATACSGLAPCGDG
jgi:hypothetical protein